MYTSWLKPFQTPLLHFRRTSEIPKAIIHKSHIVLPIGAAHPTTGNDGITVTMSSFQKLTGDPLKLKTVSFTQNTPLDIEPYTRLFGTNLTFSQQENAFVFDSSVLNLPIIYRNQQLLQIVEDHAVQMIRALKLEQSFSEMISHAIIKKFDGTIPRIQDIASNLGYSVRSLQMQLKKDNTTFKDLLALIRKNMAESYLRNPHFSISDISYALGFSEPVAFHNAFKKWTGQTPGGYRKQI
ncbi:AraC family transcriptional regulator [Paenibacillus psychroresistens]|uniref:AraC family transcriptional regulator n=1 Tax=Paenibacillus psychroresistens TaxID=1778678 RepID=A0A6B8RS09_9BACL|nr:response regulator transcription factor [Paenibacillus psychroresistens]QGQ98739.1 AraC family transcriptional regulator [Paenibacillus psychroresistens]